MLTASVAASAMYSFLLQPSLRGETLAFIHKGDVFVATQTSGWVAKRITDTAGSESFPMVSPTERQVAYLDPAGAIRVAEIASPKVGRRLTFGPRAQAVLGWKDPVTIAYASEESSPLPETFGLSFINVNGGQPTHTGVQEIGHASFAPKSDTMMFSRSAPSTGSQALFQGGEANQIVLFDFLTGKVTMPHRSRYSRMFACRAGGDLYFVGTEGQGCLNLWRIRGKQLSRMTDFGIDGVRYLSGDESQLAFERGGHIYSFNPKSRQTRLIPVRLVSEPAPTTISKNLSQWMSEISVSPKGAVGFVSRGKAYLHTKQGAQRLTSLVESDESRMTFSKDGERVAYAVETPTGRWLYTNDVSTRKELNRVPLSRDPSWIGWSADGRTCFYALDRQAVFAVEASGPVTEVGKLDRWTTSFSVSHNGRFVAVTNATASKRTRLVVFDRDTKTTLFPSDERYEDVACAFDQDRPVLYLLSRRQGRPTLGNALPDLNLQGGTVLIEIALEELAEGRSKSGKWIDLGDLAPHAIASASHGVWLHDDSGDYRWHHDSRVFVKSEIPGELEPWGVAAVKEDQSQISAHLADSNGKWNQLDAVTISGDTTFNPKSEWKTIFWGVHRFHAENFYDPDFGGVDWSAVGKHYESYLDRVTTRSELQTVLVRMTGELIGGHNGVSPASEQEAVQPQSRAPQSGMVVSWDGSGNRVVHVYRGRDDLPLFGSISNPIEGKVSVGEYIIAVNGIRLSRQLGFDQVTAEIGNPNVSLTIAKNPLGPHKIVDVTLPNRYLRYSDFLIRAEETVKRLSQRRIAYAHIFDTASQGGGSFVDGYYGRTHSEGFILDARWNRGGFANPGFINAFVEPSLFQESKRYGDPTVDRPQAGGAVALLVNREAVSGGDLLAYAFKSRQIGPIVGTTTSGRTIGNQWYRRFADGTTVRTSEANNLDSRTGRSSGENIGIHPDVMVEITPRLEFSIVDDQLEAAVQLLMKKLKT